MSGGLEQQSKSWNRQPQQQGWNGQGQMAQNPSQGWQGGGQVGQNNNLAWSPPGGAGSSPWGPGPVVDPMGPQHNINNPFGTPPGLRNPDIGTFGTGPIGPGSGNFPNEPLMPPTPQLTATGATMNQTNPALNQNNPNNQGNLNAMRQFQQMPVNNPFNLPQMGGNSSKGAPSIAQQPQLTATGATMNPPARPQWGGGGQQGWGGGASTLPAMFMRPRGWQGGGGSSGGPNIY